MIKKFLTLAFIIMSLNLFGQVDEEYSKTLKKMFEVSGSEQSFQTVIKQMFPMFRQQYPDVSQDVWNELEKEYLKTSLDDLTTMLIPVYSKYMTLDDMKELIQFYETPVGKKFAESSPLIMQESMQIGQQWGLKIAEEFIERMKEEGY